MKAPTFDELVLLPEPLALHRHFDSRNYRTFRWLLVVVALCAVAGFAGFAQAHQGWAVAAFLFDLFFCAALFVLRGREFFARNFRQVLLGFLAVEIVMLKISTVNLQGEDEIAPFIIVAFLLVFFRLRGVEHLLLYGYYWAAAVFPFSWVGLRPAGVPTPGGETIAISVVCIVCLGIAFLVTQVERRRFLAVWRHEYASHRERLRMKEEIEYARKIQLSMLPQGPPEILWLDLAAVSLPATEVGGDYYDYFRLSPTKLALVIGDVSGHGLASGLLLSGVRSSLYLLEPSLGAPIPVFEKLNHMVRRTTDRRTYMTLLCAVLDRKEGTLAVTNAGHLPVLRYDSKGCRFDEIGQGAPPLGTFLQARYTEDRQPVETGDLLIFYTDGLVEARNSLGDEYGETRLRRAVARASDSRTARQVRDDVLSDLANFKGDQEQTDDITLVVVRLRWPAGNAMEPR
ncbi:MAG TPA: PP2C family protein-serine/threonine phosphatase [Thermoanaerobaculia bacterium]|nr:PP2C family protein-serine/threonine phosphatase [Thermoanaerobaculia bacterium]